MIDPRDLLLSSYDYELRTELIAQQPIEPRHDARLMIAPKTIQNISAIRHLRIWDLLKEFQPGDLVVMNDTRVLKARVKVRLTRGGIAELLLLEPKGKGNWLCLAKPGKKLQPGDRLLLDHFDQETLILKVISKDHQTGGRIIRFPSDCADRESIEGLLERYGEVPLPPYIQHHDSSDGERYQTTFAARPGAVAAPTAGLHLSNELLTELKKRGVEQARVTLHVGLGTFRPLEKEDLTNIQLHSEWAEVREEVIESIEKCRSRGGRVIAIGTTTVRTLESSFLFGKGRLVPFSGLVDLVIKPGYKFGVIDGLLTNFHLPKSSLLLLVSALVGRKRLLALYQKAIEQKYRFFSYGDAMFIPSAAVQSEARL